MPHSENEIKKEKFYFYLEQVGEAAKRSRLILYLLVFSSAMIFAYDWKNNKEGWLDSRIDIRHDLLSHWDQLKNNTQPIGMSSDEWDKEKNREWAALERLNLNPKNDDDAKILEWQLQGFEQQWDEPFKVPFTEITIDNNDFVFFAATEVLILTVVFLHALVREEENLRISFEAMRRKPEDRPAPPLSQTAPESLHQLSEFYDMASMQQIWTVPCAGEDKVTRSFLRLGLWPIFFLPLFVIWWVLIRSALHAGSWDILNQSFGHEMIWLQYIATLLLTVTTMWAAFFFIRIDKLWADAYQDISKWKNRTTPDKNNSAEDEK